jgi:hypothetical protein
MAIVDIARWSGHCYQERKPAGATLRGVAMTNRRNTLLGCALAGLAAGLAAVALLGPLTGGPIEYHVSETLRNQTIGLHAVLLFVVAPLALAAALLAFRGHIAGPQSRSGSAPTRRTCSCSTSSGRSTSPVPGTTSFFSRCTSVS